MRRLQWLAVATAIGMFLVLLGGALVTYTGSGQGCGKDWPLCNGKFVPALTLESMIEYNHRAVTGIVGILVVLTAVGVWTYVRGRKDVQIYAGGMVFFTVLQAAMGAMAVVWSQSSAVLALHFGFSLLAFSGSLMLALAIWNPSPYGVPIFAQEGASWRSVGAARTRVIGGGFRSLVWLATVYCYAVVYLGAYVSHTTSAGGCRGWPLCNGQLIPEMSGATGVVFVHRVAALLLVLLILGLTVAARVKYRAWEELGMVTSWTLLLVLAQALTGAWVTFAVGNEEVFIFAILSHTVFLTCLFALLCYASVRVWQLQQASIAAAR